METLQSATHWHLLLNHFPVIGFMIGAGLFLLALIAQSDHLKVGSLVVLVGIALLTIPTYATGNAAERFLRDNEGFVQPIADAHEGMAMLSLALIELTGAVAWLGLWNHRRTQRIPPATAGAVLILSAVSLGAVSIASNLGGQIQHPEVRTEQATSIVGPLGRTVGTFVRDNPYTWPALETLHFVGLSLLIGVLLLIYLRMAGVMRNVSFDALDRLLPWAMLGFALNTVTGFMFFAAQADQYTRNYVIYTKMLFVVLAGLNTLYFTFDRTWMLEPGGVAPLRSKVVAATGLVLWFGVMWWGSMLPFLGTAF